MLATEPQLRGRKEPVDNQDVAVGAVVHDLGLTVVANDEERRHLALSDALRELDIDLASIVVSGQRPPGRSVALDGIAETTLRRVGQ